MPARSKNPNNWFLKKTQTYSIDNAPARSVATKMSVQVRPTEYKNAVQNRDPIINLPYFRVGVHKVGDSAVFK